jgi:hypothetical protein
VCLDVGLGGLGSMVCGMCMMPMRAVSVVRRLLMVTGFMMLGSFAVMTCGVLMMLGSLFMMMRCFFRHATDSFRLEVPSSAPKNSATRLIKGRFQPHQFTVNI